MAGQPFLPGVIVLAILVIADSYVFQLRDDLSIPSPGHWALFGGSLNPGETPTVAIRREIGEELSLDVAQWRGLWTVRYYVPFWGVPMRHVILDADVTDVWGAHLLCEGQATGVFPIDALPEPMEPIVCALLERHHAMRLGPGATSRSQKNQPRSGSDALYNPTDEHP